MQPAAMLRYAAVALALGAWTLRPLVIGEQFAQGAGHGFVFLLASFAQGAYGLALTLQPWMVDATGGRRGDRRAFATGRAVFLGGALGNAFVLALDGLTRVPTARVQAQPLLSVTTSAVVIMVVDLALVLVLLRLASVASLAGRGQR